MCVCLHTSACGRCLSDWSGGQSAESAEAVIAPLLNDVLQKLKVRRGFIHTRRLGICEQTTSPGKQLRYIRPMLW